MRIVSAHVARPVDACWRVFTDVEQLLHWVPGLRTATPVAFDFDGLPEEVAYEFVAGHTYSLRYTYDTDAYVVRWEPIDEAGKRGGVRGFARFIATDDGTQVTYALEHDAARKAAERAIDDPRTIVDAFARYMHEDRD